MLNSPEKKILLCESSLSDACPPKLQRRRTSLWLVTLFAITITHPLPLHAGKKEIPLIVVDQFGYRTKARKIAVFANPQEGQNARRKYEPGDVFEVRRLPDEAVAFKGRIVQWNEGKKHSQSGDKCWQGDFSKLQTPGKYYILDPAKGEKSYPFEIRDDIYEEMLKHAVRGFFYQRCGIDITKEHGGDWNHKACHVRRNQDKEAGGCGYKGPVKDVSGGWHDAGDMGKYVRSLEPTLWWLMKAYENNPGAHKDNLGIPESGNGVPDLLDEIKWSLDWILRMQMEDGSFSGIVSTMEKGDGESPPNDYFGSRCYSIPTTSVTAIAAGLLAHAARIYGKHPMRSKFPGFGRAMIKAAEKGWAYLQANPEQVPKGGFTPKGFHGVGDEGKGLADRHRRLFAAAQLFATTKKQAYNHYFLTNIRDPKNAKNNPIQRKTMEPMSSYPLRLGLWDYCFAPGADKGLIREYQAIVAKEADTWILTPFRQNKDPYLSYMFEGHYSWGSTRNNCMWAEQLLAVYFLRANPKLDSYVYHAAEGYLHYIHGMNPLNLVYMTNMGPKGAKAGAENSVMEIYHGWFADSTIYDGERSDYGPAPGIVPGGPNKFYTGQKSPPKFEPAQKAYRDWNATDWKADISWEISENSITYQSSYIFLCSFYCPR